MAVALDDDIQRIAALRGKNPAHYADLAARQQAAARQIQFVEILNMVQAQAGPHLDLPAYEALPEASRAFIREFPFSISANTYGRLLLRVGDEKLLIAAVNQALPNLRRQWAKGLFGERHPSARKPA